MKLSLAPSFEPIKAPGTAEIGMPALDPAGPRCVLGWDETGFAVPNAPSASVLFGPRGAALMPDGSLWVADTGHHRLLGWRKCPEIDNQPADILIGQPTFAHEGRNAKTEPTAVTMNVPTGVSPWGKTGLAVADAWNHRVLLWRHLPTEHNQPADIILGQPDAHSILANHGSDAPTATSLHWPYGVSAKGNAIYVCDTGNRRVLVWQAPEETGQPADLVLGQRDFVTRDENAGEPVGPTGMRWPHTVTFWDGTLCVSDAGNNRIMIWQTPPQQNGTPCDTVLGQANMYDCDHNQTSYYPRADTTNMPYAAAAAGERLLVADTANSRLIGFEDQETGAPATLLAAQPDFASKGDNRWGIAERDSLCWPYGLTVQGQTAVISDSGNNRVMLWTVAP